MSFVNQAFLPEGCVDGCPEGWPVGTEGFDEG